VLHELQGLYLEVAAAVNERIADPARPLAEDIAFFLDDKVRKAGRAARDVEFPDRPPRWIARLAAVVKAFSGPDAGRLSRELEKLRVLPSEFLSDMNKELLDNASRLEPRQLLAALDGIRAALGDRADAVAGQLRGRVQDFRTLCQELDDLIRAHNLCQTIDNALHEAEGLPVVTPAELSDWEDAKKSLGELAVQRQTDLRVVRTAKAARLFEAADQGPAFTKLMECFNDLFMETDKTLLELTNRMPREALALHTALEAFL
jgi:hypothetical protein